MSAPGPIKLTYFGIEGAAEKVRLAMVLGGIDFEDHRINFDDWKTMKPTTKYGQLPVMTIGGGEPIAQSGAMMRYMGQLAGLYPAEKMLKIEEAIGLGEDMQREIMPSMYMGMRPQNYGYPEDMPEDDRKAVQLRLRAKLMEADGAVPRCLGYLENYLGDQKFMAGDEVTIADCQIVPQLRHLKKGVLDGIPATVVDGYPKLSAYLDRFHDLPKVKAYHEKLAAAAAK